MLASILCATTACDVYESESRLDWAPPPAPAVEPDRSNFNVFYIAEDGAIKLNDIPVSEESLAQAIEDMPPALSGTSPIIVANPKATTGDIANLRDALFSSGHQNVGLVVGPDPSATEN